jgi:hypothetical protein
MRVESVLVMCLFLFIGGGGYLLINNAVLNMNYALWSFTGHEIAAAITPLSPWIWLIAFVSATFYVGYQGKN